MDRMSMTDAGFYFAEGENTPMHVGSVAVFEGPAPSYGDVIRLLLSKLPKVPRYRQRVRALPLHLSRPLWTDDEHFQILYHVRHTAVPRPGGAEQLRKGVNDEQALLIGIKCERGSHKFFKRYGERFEDSEGKQVFLEFADEERTHLDLLIREYKALRERQARKAPDKRAKRAAR